MIKSYAKVNIFLEIVGKLDGFHKLHSLFVKIDLFDEIFVKKSEKFKSTYSGAKIESDILIKTEKVLRKHFEKINTDFEFDVHKKIPIGGGLGGASSNAAEVVKFLLEVNDIVVTHEKLLEIGGEIGADVPFFLCNDAMILCGVGKELTKPVFEIPKLWFVLHIPKFACITKEIFAKIKPPYSRYEEVLSFADCLKRCNDMQNVADEISCGLIAQSLKKLHNDNALKVAMSGSGSVCFAVFDGEKHIKNYRNNPEFIVCRSV